MLWKSSSSGIVKKLRQLRKCYVKSLLNQSLPFFLKFILSFSIFKFLPTTGSAVNLQTDVKSAKHKCVGFSFIVFYLIWVLKDINVE